jgi:DNA polymerase-3 subunit beta
MEFTASRNDLVRELTLALGSVETKTTIPVLGTVLIEADGEQARLTSTDLTLGIRLSLPAKVKTPGAVAIPAKRLFEYIKLLPDADVKVETEANDWTKIACGRSKTRIAGVGAENFPALPSPGEPSASLPVSVLAGLIQSTVFAISTEESRFTLSGALLVLEPERATMVATDGHRLALMRADVATEAMQTIKTLVPIAGLNELLKLSKIKKDATVQISADENHLYFSVDGRVLTVRKLAGNFPDFERVLPKEHPHSVTLGRGDTYSAIERVSKFADERSRAVRIRVAPGELRVSASLSETGDSEESMPVEYSGPEVELGFNGDYLLEFLKAATSALVEFHFKDSSSAGELRPKEGSDYRYVVMPMRV